MKPIHREMEFEKVKIGEFVEGEIVKIEYDQEHKSNYQGVEKIGPAVRLVFELKGYKYPHRSRWMSFSYGEKANLYKKYLTKLVEGACPDMDFDLDNLKNMRVKTIWTEENGFQSIDSIFPIDKKIALNAVVPILQEADLGTNPEEIDIEELEGQK